MIRLGAIVLAICLSWLPVAMAGSIDFKFGNPLTKTYTANQDTKLASFVARLNVQRAAADPPHGAVTIEQYVANRCEQTIIDDLQQTTADDAADACANYKKLGAGPKGQIDAALGGKSPCP